MNPAMMTGLLLRPIQDDLHLIECQINIFICKDSVINKYLITFRELEKKEYFCQKDYR